MLTMLQNHDRQGGATSTGLGWAAVLPISKSAPVWARAQFSRWGHGALKPFRLPSGRCVVPCTTLVGVWKMRV